jgi:hypothetical protein
MCNRLLPKERYSRFIWQKFKKISEAIFLPLPIFIIKKVINVKPIGGFSANERLFFNKDKMSCETQTGTYCQICTRTKRTDEVIARNGSWLLALLET